MAQSRFSRNVGAAVLVGLFSLFLGVVFYAFPPWEVATDSSDKLGHDSMAQLPVALWWLGSAILGIALVYVTLNNRRSRSDIRITEQATQRNYIEEDEKARF